MNNYSVIPEFIDSPQGRIFVIHHHPQSDVRGGVLLVPPFAEEMNRSRRMMTLVAEALAMRGFHVVLPDLYGTGDSEGDFSEASWQGWVQQLEATMDATKQRFAVQCDALLGIRSGALLSLALLQLKSDIKKLILWQPVIDGAVYLNQFLRLRLAADMLQGNGNKESGQALKQRLSSGECVEVAGYGLTSAVSDGLAAASFKAIDAALLPSVYWIDLVASAEMTPPVPHQKCVEAWREQGVDVRYQHVIGDSFWTSVETLVVPDVLSLSVRFIEGVEELSRDC